MLRVWGWRFNARGTAIQADFWFISHDKYVGRFSRHILLLAELPYRGI